MLRVLFFPGIGLAFFALWIYCILDVIATDEHRCRNLPKVLWLVLVVVLPTVGSLAWLGLGRPLYAGWQPGGAPRAGPRPVRGPEDSPGWDTHWRDRRERPGDSQS